MVNYGESKFNHADYVALRPDPVNFRDIWSTEQLNQLQGRLDRNLGPEYISYRPGGGGQRVPYLEGWKAIVLANETFGFNGWCTEIRNCTIDYTVADENKFSVGCSVVMRITLRDGTYHEDIGYGTIDNSRSRGQAYEKCKKEATTDAIKRTLRNFGNVLGNCVYDNGFLRSLSKLTKQNIAYDHTDLHRAPEPLSLDTAGPSHIHHGYAGSNIHVANGNSNNNGFSINNHYNSNNGNNCYTSLNGTSDSSSGNSNNNNSSMCCNRCTCSCTCCKNNRSDGNSHNRISDSSSEVNNTNNHNNNNSNARISSNLKKYNDDNQKPSHQNNNTNSIDARGSSTHNNLSAAKANNEVNNGEAIDSSKNKKRHRDNDEKLRDIGISIDFSDMSDYASPIDFDLDEVQGTIKGTSLDEPGPATVSNEASSNPTSSSKKETPVALQGPSKTTKYDMSPTEEQKREYDLMAARVEAARAERVKKEAEARKPVGENMNLEDSKSAEEDSDNPEKREIKKTRIDHADISTASAEVDDSRIALALKAQEERRARARVVVSPSSAQSVSLSSASTLSPKASQNAIDSAFSNSITNDPGGNSFEFIEPTVPIDLNTAPMFVSARNAVAIMTTGVLPEGEKEYDPKYVPDSMKSMKLKSSGPVAKPDTPIKIIYGVGDATASSGQLSQSMSASASPVQRVTSPAATSVSRNSGNRGSKQFRPHTNLQNLVDKTANAGPIQYQNTCMYPPAKPSGINGLDNNDSTRSHVPSKPAGRNVYYPPPRKAPEP
ncbi:hypothetical protein NADFUDRAFT_51447 [Nadsonia fulvescens var. elongata DSM 6958]|uniref:DNA repair and recombination protein RAD52 n=1 Tax=Nadsonia fulvescens var. elongata DSM 6958 TaxID=857566 RepID=A0A1E3PJ17_9ASCO|nr:hypothetical protein NADFUDRAFT_51447 [Nadsonia fulvescens var. elongata DSM 6958]